MEEAGGVSRRCCSMASGLESKNNAPSGAFTEGWAAALREVSGGLKRIVDELRSMTLPAIRLSDMSWLDDYNGITRHITVHGFLLNKNKYPELYATVRALLSLAEIDAERIELYATIEDGVTIHIEKDVSNEYGRELGTDHKNLPIQFLIEEAKEKVQQYNIEKLKEALHRLLESLDKEVKEDE